MIWGNWGLNTPASSLRDFSEPFTCADTCAPPRGSVVSSTFQITGLCFSQSTVRNPARKHDLVCLEAHAFRILAWLGGRAYPLPCDLLSPFVRRDILKSHPHRKVFTVEPGSYFPKALSITLFNQKYLLGPDACPDR